MKKNILQWPVKEHSTPILHKDRFQTNDGLGNFIYNQYELRGQIKELINKNISGFYLTTGRILEQYNNSRQTNETTKLEKRYDEDILLVSNEDNFDKDKRYILKTKYGKTAPLKIKISKHIKKNTLYCTFHHSKTNLNYIFGDESDSKTLTARFKSIRVDIEPC